MAIMSNIRFLLADDMRAGRRLNIQGLMPAKICADGFTGIRVQDLLQTGCALVQDGPQAR